MIILRFSFLVTLLLFLSTQLSLFSEEKISAAYMIADQIKKCLDLPDEKYIGALIEGIEAHSKGINLSIEELEIIDVQRDKISYDNLIASEKWLKKINADVQMQTIVPSKLLYKIIKEGHGNQLSLHNGNVIVNYSINNDSDIFQIKSEILKTLDLSQVIPGMAHGMISMREGEIREIYIHPNFIYGNSTNFDPNRALKITIELLTILPKQSKIPDLREISSSPPSHYFDNEYQKIQLKNSFVMGWKLWRHLKWGYNLFDKNELILFLKDKNKVLLPSTIELNRDINRIHWKIYHQRIEDEYKTAHSYLDQISQQPDIKCLVPGYLYCTKKNIKVKPENYESIKIKSIIKDKNGHLLRREMLETINCDISIKGLKEGLKYLLPGEPATLYIHPEWGYPDVDSPLGDTLLIMDVTVIKNHSK